ncbi:MAG: WecB/TagA/CpsF family glycosyltransferase [bacterium]
MYILGVKVDNLNKKEVLAKMDEFLNSEEQYYITTPNPEIVLRAQKDEDYQNILNYADLAIADGVGLILASIFFFGWRGRFKQRIRGVDLVEWLIETKENSRVDFFLLGGKFSIAALAAEKLKRKFSKLQIVGAESGPKINQQGRPQNEQEEIINNQIIEKINQTKPQILLVAFGAPKQEKWIHNYLAQIPSVKIAIGIGGTFDFLAGKIKRAPQFWQETGLEWLWRLIQEPKRWRRIYNAVIVFPIKCILWRWRRLIFYRPNACAFIYQGEKILVVERVDDPGHWQFPQGGLRKGEKIEQGILREMEEELGADQFRIKKIVLKAHKYIWDKHQWSKKFITEKRKTFYPYKGQKQTLVILEFMGSDSDIKLDRKEFTRWQWVTQDKLIKTLHPYRHTIGQKALEEFKKL